MPERPGWRWSPAAPLATPRQRNAEERAVACFNSERVRDARAATLRHFEADRNASLPDQGLLLRQSVDEHYFHAALMAVSEMPGDPAFTWTLAHDHDWLGLAVPGSRFGQDNPDNCYRLAAVDPARSYRIVGRFADVPSCDFSICALSGQPGERLLANTTAIITRALLDLGPGGSFSILVDASPTAGRRNHLSIADARMLFARDTLADWTVEKPAFLHVEPRQSRSVGQLSADAVETRAAELGDTIARYMLDVLQHGMFERGPVNTLNPPWAAGEHGGLPTQASSIGHYRLPADHALLITADRLDAAYLGMQITDVWMLSYEYRHRASSLNQAQAQPDLDGRIRWVISLQDPGVPNWLDSGGNACGTILLRWQGLQRGRVPSTQSISCELVPCADIRSRLPAETPRVGQEQRAAWAIKRLQAYQNRLGQPLPP